MPPFVGFWLLTNLRHSSRCPSLFYFNLTNGFGEEPEKLIAVASEEVVFPNGPLEWFIERGYEDLGEVFCEENDQARMHLVKKKL